MVRLYDSVDLEQLQRDVDDCLLTDYAGDHATIR